MYIPRCLEQFETNAVQLNFANRILENLFSEATSLPFLVNKTCMRPILRCLECTDSTTVILAIQGLDCISEIDGGVNTIVQTGIETIISSISREEDIQGPAIRVFKRILLERPDALELHVKRSENHITPTVLALIAVAIRDASVDLTTNKGLQILLTHWNHEISDEAEFATVLENQATFVAQGEYIVTQAPGLLADLLRSENDDVNSIIARVCHFASDKGVEKLFSKVGFELLCKMAMHSDDNVLWLMAKLVVEGCNKGAWIDALDMKLLLDAIQQILTQTRHSETWTRLAQAMRLIIARTGVLTWVTEHFSMFLQITDQLVQHAEPSVVVSTAIYMKVCAEQSIETFNTKPQDLTKTAMKILGGHPQVKVKTAFCEILLMLVRHEEIQSHLVQRSMIQPLTKIFKIDNLELQMTIVEILDIILHSPVADRVMFTNQALPSALLQNLSTVTTASASVARDKMQQKLRQKCTMLLQIFAHVKQHHKSMNSEEACSILVNVVLRREESSSKTAMQILQEVYPEGHSIKALCAEIEDLEAGDNQPKDAKAEKLIQLTADRDSLQAELIQARQSGTAGSGKKEVGLQLMQRLFDHWHSQNQQLFFMTWKDFKVEAQTESKQKFKALKKVMQSLMSSETSRAFKNFHKQFSAGVAEQLRVGDVQTIQSELDEIKVFALCFGCS